MKKLKDNIIPLSLMISIPILNIFYGILNNDSRGVYSLMTSIDRVIPFTKSFIIPYIIWYPFIFLIMVYLCIKDIKAYYKTLLCLNIGFIVSYIIFYFFQTAVSRPVLGESDILIKLVGIIYKTDNPYNCFPSLHVLTTYFVMKGISEVEKNKKITLPVNIIGILIILSTLFIKQHVVLDVIFAIVLGEIIVRVVSVMRMDDVDTWIKKQFSTLIMKNKLEN
ncbi:phosphatase PAP2 family protein [Clostridium ganghwense]|uniref:Phosphatase PAP2 family protein n=1 Tax=Clostridium ganghwense TaxID=312089 RepID=A0ABT4CJA4_9CLOT|nr:phosphatase PAP2 family protein [Clostridium ganghwense]MCY6369126.1 phosphatase PAP2 family protein [Clostridium ganghwense]